MFVARDAKRWIADFKKHWPDVVLPNVHCEMRKSSAGRREGRCAALEAELPLASWFPLDAPVLLLTHREPKPWGAEIWYTGIEKRGICSVRTVNGVELSLPELLVLWSVGSPEQVRTPSLLKILDPQPDRDKGSLYIEVHQQKWETYIVTAVSRQLYPDGVGEILFGFSLDKLSELKGNEEAFRSELLVEVQNYEVLRRALDADLSGEPNSLTPSTLPRAELERQAQEQWKKVRAFFRIQRVTVGDVVQVPPFMPHSLQPGVRVVEFQTPTYERLILAFNQKVLTQSHWDTAQAIECAVFDNFNRLENTMDSLVADWQPIVDFPQFRVMRRRLRADECFEIPPVGDGQFGVHTILFIVSGQVEIFSRQNQERLSVSAEQAVLLPQAKVGEGWILRNLCIEGDTLVLLCS